MRKIINTTPIRTPIPKFSQGFKELLKVYSPSCVVADAQERAGVMRSYHAAADQRHPLRRPGPHRPLGAGQPGRLPGCPLGRPTWGCDRGRRSRRDRDLHLGRLDVRAVPDERRAWAQSSTVRSATPTRPATWVSSDLLQGDRAALHPFTLLRQDGAD